MREVRVPGRERLEGGRREGPYGRLYDGGCGCGDGDDDDGELRSADDECGASAVDGTL